MPHPIQRLDKVLLPLRQKFGVFFLNVGRVGEHYCAEVACCGSGPDCFAIALRNQKRQPSGMVDVRMRDKHLFETENLARWQRGLYEV